MNTEQAHSLTKNTRPKWIWAIFLFYILSASYTLFSYVLVFSGAIPISNAQKAYFDSLSVFDHAITLAIMACNLSGAISLFLLRKIAYKLFTSALSISLVVLIYHSIVKGFYTALGSSGFIGFLIGTTLSVTIILYSKSLADKGTLR